MEIEINGILAEIGTSQPSITKKSIDVNNPSARFVDFTNRFQLPDTVINRQIFESPQGIGTNNKSFDKLYEVIIRDEFIIFRGQGFLDSSNFSAFSFQVIDRSKDLFKSLNSKLNTLSWDDKDTVLTTANIDALDVEDDTTCWFWGKACYHENAIQANTDQTTGDARVKYSRPALYINGLLKRAIENQGYTFTSPSPGLAFSSNHKDFWFTSYQKTITATYNISGTLNISGLTTNDFAKNVVLASTTIDIGNYKTKFRIRGQATSTADISLIVKATDLSDGTKIEEQRFALNTSTSGIDLETNEFHTDSVLGYRVEFIFSGTGDVDFTNVFLYTLLNEKEEDLSTNPWLDYKIKVHDNLPDVAYLDLFKTVNLIYNKYQIVDSFNKTFEFGSFANINKLNRVDWSDKFIIDSESVTANIDSLAQKNFLKYSNDETVNIDLGEDYFLTDNTSLLSENDYIVIKFGASRDAIINSNLISQLNIYNDITRIADQDINIRLFEIVTDKLQFTPITWGNLKENYYSSLFDSFFRIRAIECLMNLNKLDVLSWTEKQLIFIDYFSSTFQVLEINNFIPGKATKIKILKHG